MRLSSVNCMLDVSSKSMSSYVQLCQTIRLAVYLQIFDGTSVYYSANIKKITFFSDHSPGDFRKAFVCFHFASNDF